MDNRIPVTLLTGFLGSGKTTLLNKLLINPGMRDTAVIINELGEAGLDQILASALTQNVESTHIADNTVLLESGCLCCTLRNEMADTLRDLFFKRALQAIPQFRRLVIETTGMADPGAVMAHLLNEPVIRSTYRLDAVVVTVDATHGLRQLAEHGEAARQAAVADILLITKSDLADSGQMEALCEALTAINPGASQHNVLHGDIAPALVVDVGLFDAATHEARPQRWLRAPAAAPHVKATLPQGQHSDDIRSFTVTLPVPLDWRQLEPALSWLCANYSQQLLRLKGIIHAADQPHPLAVHAVHETLYPPTLLEGWNEESPQNRIVIIGKGLDDQEIRKKLMQI